jgi:hypothetical protein
MTLWEAESVGSLPTSTVRIVSPWEARRTTEVLCVTSSSGASLPTARTQARRISPVAGSRRNIMPRSALTFSMAESRMPAISSSRSRVDDIFCPMALRLLSILREIISLRFATARSRFTRRPT